MTLHLTRFAAAAAVTLALIAGNAAAQPDDATAAYDGQDADTAPSVEADADANLSDDADAATQAEVSAPATTAATATAAAGLAGYKKGFFIKQADGPFVLKLKGRVQGRYTYEAKADDRTDESAFSIARARLTLSGNAFEKGISYKFQSDFGKGNVVLKDFFLDYTLGGSIRVRVGQWKRPFSRQQINSSSKLELVDRAITDKAFGAGRDIGLALHNNYEESPEGLEWAVGVFNGTGDKPRFSGSADPMTGDVGGKFSNVPDMFGPAIVARAGWNSPDLKGYSEADMEGGPFRYGVATSVLIELDSDNDDSSAVKGQLDYVGKVNGLSTSAGIYVATGQDGSGFADQAYATGGAHLQAGYMLDKKLQPAVRLAVVAHDDDANGTLVEGAGGISYYMHKHGLKWQTDLALRSTSTTDAAGTDVSTSDVMVRSQLQLSF